MMDLMVLAFQADVTRVTTFVLANEGSNRPYPFVDVAEGHHYLSHHSGDEEKIEKSNELISSILNSWHTSWKSWTLPPKAMVRSWIIQ